MKKIITSLPLWAIVALSVFISIEATKAQTFTNGNLALFVASASASNTTGTIVEINTSSSGQAAINSFSISGTGTNAMRFSGSATSTAYLTNTDDGSLLCFTGANSTNTASNVNTLNPRGVGILDHSFNFAIACTYTGTSGNQTRSASSIDNSTWYIGDQGGFYSNGTSSASPSGNIRSVKSFGGTVYGFTASTSLAPVGIISAPTGGTYTGLSGLGVGASSRQDFYLISSGSNGSAYDVLYIMDATSNTAGTIFKYSLVSGTWTANGSYTTTFGGFGIAAKLNGSGADLFVTSGQGALTANSVIKLNDAAGYNTTINITTASNITLYTTAAGTIIKGVAFAPICTPPSINSVAVNGPVCQGTTLTFTSSASGTAPLSYSWTGPNSYTSNVQNPSLSGAMPAASGVYTVTTSNACGNAVSTVSTTVNASPTPTITPGGATTFCSGGSVDLNCSSANSYTWSTSANTSSITVNSSGNYSVSVTDVNGCVGSSTVTAVTVNPNVTPALTINANPGSTICSGTSVTFSAIPTNGGASPVYQWILNGTPVGTNSASYTNSSLANGDQVVCTFTSNASCASPVTASSNTISINVSTSVTPSVSISAPSVTVCAGSPISFTAAPSNGGSSPSYQWQVNGANTGSNSPNYSSTGLNDQDVVTCVLTSSDACASPTTAVSNSLTITVNNVLTPSVSISANPGNTVCSGTSVTFSASATNGGTPVYQWFKNAGAIGTNASTYTDGALVTGDLISCTMTSNANCASPTSALSQTITMTVNAIPATPTVTGTFTFCAGGSTVLDAGSGYSTYLWSTGATTQTISVNTAGNFSVTASNGTCGSTSPVVTTTIVTAPSQPTSFTVSSAVVNVGQNGVVYSVPNIPGVIYTWIYSGTGATINGSGNSITIDFASNATGGTLSVTASNNCGTSPALTMAITVNPASFTMGNLVVLMTSNTASKASSQITLKEFTTSGTPGASISIPTTGSYPLQTAGVFGGSEGFLTRSTDAKYLVLAGYATSSSFTDITATSAGTVTRAIGTVSQSGAYTQVASSNSFFTLNDIRGAVSDGTNFWASGASGASFDGIDYFGPGAPDGLATGTTPPKAYGLRIFNGQIFYSTQKAGPVNTTSQLGIFSISGGTPTANPVTVTQVINTSTTVVEDFSFNPSLDVCYIAVNLNSSAGGIQKWTNSGGTWSLAYTLGTGLSNIGAYGIEVDYSGVNPIIYATTFDAAGNRIIKITDTGAGSSASTIVPATAGVYYKGITFAPIASGIPVVNLSVSSNSGSEAAASVITVTATASSAVSGTQTVSLNVSGSGITGGDYTLSNNVITIPNGATTGTATFTIVDDALIEGTEVAALTISNPSSGIVIGGIATQTISITDNDGNNPPTLSLNVSTTTDYLDWALPSSPASPFSISGTYNDPTDPPSTLGVDFLVNDIETPVASLTVTATSSNTTVVPSNSVSVSGSGAIRNIKVKGIAVGYSDIVVTVSDGAATASYTLNYACSEPSPMLIPAQTFWHTGMSDGSDAVAIDDNYYMSGDDELDVVNVYSRNASGLPLVSFDYAGFLNLPDPSKPEVDVEAGTPSVKTAGKAYWLGSMSNGKAPFPNKPNRDRLFATTYSGTGATTNISFAGYCTIKNDLLSWGDSYGYGFTASAAAGVDSKSFSGYAAEGMVFAPDSTTLWIAFRAPLVPTNFRTKAVIAPLLNFETWFNNGNPTGPPSFGAPIELDLNLNGIRDIIRLSNGTYIIIAGGPVNDAGTTSMYKWTGNPNDAPVSITSAADGILNMEGAMEIHNGGNLSLTQIQVISDLGDNILYNDANEAKDFGDLKLRKFRSDILNNVDLNICSGFPSTINSTGNTTFCLGDSVKLNTTAATGITYQWMENGSTINGAITTTYYANNSGAYYVVATNTIGCTVNSNTVTVVVNPAPATPTVTQNGNVLSSSAAVSYQWYYNGSSINGATSQTYTASQNGAYAVEITDGNGCTSMSGTVSVNSTGLKNGSSYNDVNVKPNPFSNSFTLSFHSENGTDRIEILNSIGQLVLPVNEIKIIKGLNHLIITLPSSAQAGMYYLRITNGTSDKNLKLSKIE